MSEQTEAEYFADAVGELFSTRIKGFARWLETEWRLTDKAGPELDLTPEQIIGWNRCCDSLEGAALIWLDEMGPS